MMTKEELEREFVLYLKRAPIDTGGHTVYLNVTKASQMAKGLIDIMSKAGVNIQ